MITPILYARGAGGVPSSATALTIPNLASYRHSIAAVGGFESCQITFVADLEAALYWLSQLMASIVVYGPDAEVVWEGFLSDVSVSAGQEQVSLALTDMANAVKVRYQSDIGVTSVTAFVTDAASLALYGRKELVYSGSGMTTLSAASLASALLDARRNPLSARSSDVSLGSASSDMSITLSGTGWYYTLDWLLTSNAATTTAATTAQALTLLTGYQATNAFFSLASTDMLTSGLSDTQYINDDTTYRAALERLLTLGTSTNERQAWGVYEDRRFRVNTWAAATPTSVTYQRSLGDGVIRNAAGSTIAPWDVRPDAMYQVNELLAAGPVSTAQDAQARYYVERVTCSVEGTRAGVRLEPARSSSLDTLLAKLR